MTSNTRTDLKVKKSKWGVGIFSLYGGFVVFIVSLAIFVSMQEVQYTEANYYEKGLAYQDKIEKIRRTSQLTDKLMISQETGAIQIGYSDSSSYDKIEGAIKFFRPSNAKLDFELKLNLDQGGSQLIKTDILTSGLWKIQVDWQINSVEYFIEKTVYLE